MGRPGGGTAPIGVSVVRNGVAGKSGIAGASGNANRPGGFRARAPGPGGGHLGNFPWALRAALHTLGREPASGPWRPWPNRDGRCPWTGSLNARTAPVPQANKARSGKHARHRASGVACRDRQAGRGRVRAPNKRVVGGAPVGPCIARAVGRRGFRPRCARSERMERHGSTRLNGRGRRAPHRRRGTPRRGSAPARRWSAPARRRRRRSGKGGPPRRRRG